MVPPCLGNVARSAARRYRRRVRACLLCILNEEWEHRLYAERDLAALEAREP